MPYRVVKAYSGKQVIHQTNIQSILCRVKFRKFFWWSTGFLTSLTHWVHLTSTGRYVS